MPPFLSLVLLFLAFPLLAISIQPTSPSTLSPAESPAQSPSTILLEHEAVVIDNKASADVQKEIESALLEARSFKSQATGACKSTVSQTCDPCYNADGPSCGDWLAECDKLMCNPLCLRYTWDVKIKATGGTQSFQQQVNSIPVQYAMAAQFRAHACVNGLGCCEDNESLGDWVEQRTYAGYFPHPRIPVPACQTGDMKGQCSTCSSALEIEATIKEGVCDYFIDPGAPPSNLATVFGRSNSVPMPPQIPKHKSFRARCEAVQKMLSSKLPSLVSEFKNKACQCLGCCESKPNEECFFPVAYSTVEDAAGIKKKK